MFNAIQNPQIAAGFSSLAQALGGGGGNASSVIEADMERRRGGLIDAQTATQGAHAQYYGAQTLETQTDTRQTQMNIDGVEALAALLAGGAVSTADLAAAAARGAIDPNVLAGLATFANPNFAGSPEALATILNGTGVQNFENTEVGQRRSLDNSILLNDADNLTSVTNNQLDNVTSVANNDADNLTSVANNDADNLTSIANNDADNVAAATAAALVAARPVPPASVGTNNSMLTLLVQSLEGMSAPGTEIDPATLQAIRPLLQEEYTNNGGNAFAAVQAILGGIPQTNVAPERNFIGKIFRDPRDPVMGPDLEGYLAALLGGGAAPIPAATPTAAPAAVPTPVPPAATPTAAPAAVPVPVPPAAAPAPAGLAAVLGGAAAPAAVPAPARAPVNTSIPGAAQPPRADAPGAFLPEQHASGIAIGHNARLPDGTMLVWLGHDNGGWQPVPTSGPRPEPSVNRVTEMSVMP
jgi:hypothetical protein